MIFRILLLLFLSNGFCLCGNAQQNSVKNTFSISPETPEPGTELTVWYSPEKTDASAAVSMRCHSFYKNKLSIVDYPMKFSGNQWNAVFTIASQDRLIVVSFLVNGKKDDNKRSGYIIPLYYQGDTLRESVFQLSEFYFRRASLVRMKTDTVRGEEYALLYYRSIPPQEITPNEWMNYQLIKKDTAEVRDVLTKISKKWGLPPQQYVSAYEMAQRIGDVPLAQKIAENIRGFLHDYHYPYEDYKKILASRDWEKNLVMIGDFRRKYPAQVKEGGSFKLQIDQSRYNAYFQLGRYSIALLEVPQFPERRRAQLYYNIAQTILQKQETSNYAIAREAMQKALPLLEKESKELTQKPPYQAPEDYKEGLKTQLLRGKEMLKKL